MKPANLEQLTRLKSLVRRDLDGGAIGISLVTWPGISRYEVIEMFRLAAERRSFASSDPALAISLCESDSVADCLRQSLEYVFMPQKNGFDIGKF